MHSSWICIITFCLFLCICINIESVHTSSVSYSDHCSTVVPQSDPTFRTHKESAPYLTASYIIGGDRLLGKKEGNHNYVGKSLNLEILPKSYETVNRGIYKIEALLYIQSVYRYPLRSRRNYNYTGSSYRKRKDQESIRFLLEGFWSENSRMLCMVGSAYFEVENGKIVLLNAVLKVKNANEDNPNIYTSVVSGTLESADSANDLGYFDPFFIFSFPALSNYNYSLVSKDDGMFSNDFNVPKNQSLMLTNFCALVTERPMFLDMEYAMECREYQHCSSRGASEGSSSRTMLPPFLSLDHIQCSEGERKVRYIAKFQETSYPESSFALDSTLIVEALWDDKTNHLFGVACRILNPTIHLRNVVGDCTIRLSLRFPSIWTIRNDAEIVGQIWSTKSVADSGYFRQIDLSGSNQIGVLAFVGLRYEYTEMGRVRKLCERKTAKTKGGRNTYPDGNSYAMRFDLTVKDSKGADCGWGYAKPVSVGNTIFEVIAMSDHKIESNNSPINISYKIRINPSNTTYLFPSMNLHRQVEITAEGVFESETGYLCMVGCRKVVFAPLDCEILVKFEFAPLDGERGGFIKGTIKSTRAETDPLFFEDLGFSSSAYYPEVAERSIKRMDFEIIMILISNTLSCIFVALQILHVKRNPEVSCFISLVMLVILCLGNMIPLVSNRELLLLSNGGRIEEYETMVRVMNMVTFFLHVRLTQLVWAAKKSWTGEKKPVVAYILGGLVILLVEGNWRSYAGLVVDGFLIPQILVNIFAGSAQKALAGSFYIGISAVRLVPHAYNQYRVHSYPTFDVKETYYYANQDSGFYSTAWDMAVPCGVVVLAEIVFTQQRRGGRCILPRRLRGWKCMVRWLHLKRVKC